MKQKLLLSFFIAAFTVSAHAQKKAQKTTAYVITSAQKGNSNWTEVKLVDVTTGEEIQSVYQSKEEVPVMNARTGKAIVKKDLSNDPQQLRIREVARELNNVKELKELKNAPTAVEPNSKRVMVFKFNNDVSVM